ncbi:1-aminocyclopropane-1-carboxylate oxidase [Cyberlindnera fabianii]|uniref:1-aminocyclopropane-1-carboxylate oxidase n=1 Tax=Cyberlindnera fabianii TaxID=36022 RepID=A0A1V2L1N4_CYBFA|nr:1-aminocyclopropane-1-carboxylate oxidase [Cyberlindnera fabianii]
MPSKETESSVPIVDFAPFLNGGQEGKVRVGKQMVSVMKEYGFMYITNHGILQKDQDAIFEWSKKFFAMPTENKMKCPHPPLGSYHRGYSSLGKEKASQAIFMDGEERIKTENVPDIKESFDIGNPEDNSVYKNLWPDAQDIPEFQNSMEQYWAKCNVTSKLFLRAIALGMNLEEEFFLDYHKKSENQLRLLHYPPTDEANLKTGKAERIGAHTDFGTLTMLLQDECGGLQVEHPYQKGVFLPAPYIKGSIVMNTGDFLQRWSNDTLKSTLHRVTAPPVNSETGISKVRYSIPYFVCADADKVIDALEGTYGDMVPKKYEPITSGEYLTMRLNATY